MNKKVLIPVIIIGILIVAVGVFMLKQKAEEKDVLISQEVIKEEVKPERKISEGLVDEEITEQGRNFQLHLVAEVEAEPQRVFDVLVDYENLKEELGDVLLHVVFYSKIASEEKTFDIADVINSLCDKLKYRHPHIYGDIKVADEREVADNWEQLKLKEKGGNKSVLAGIPKSLPAMVKANRIQEKVKGVGFDWEDKSQIWDKVIEEFKELKHEIKKQDDDKTEAEFGDVFFALINAARLYGINPEDALQRTNEKFIKRFNYLESKTISAGKSLKDMSLEEMDVYWEEAKKFEK